MTYYVPHESKNKNGYRLPYVAPSAFPHKSTHLLLIKIVIYYKL